MNDKPIVERDVTIGGERIALVVTTYHEGVIATTAIHRHDFQRRIGGARFVESTGGLSEVGHLSSTMTEKCMAAMIPADGQKSVIVTGSGAPLSEEKKAAILIEHVRVVKDLDPGVIVGPDMNNPESVQDLAARAEGLLDHFTGLSEANCGLSIDKYGYTAHGLVAAIRACVDDASLAEQRVSIQGFGAVGAHTARLLGKLGARVVAVNNKDVLLTNPDGLDVPALFARWRQYGDDGIRQFTDARVSTVPDEIFGVPTDIFVPAARTDVLAMADELEHVRQTENENVRDVADFHAATGVRLVVEGANHPISGDAERWLESKGVTILPDFIVNCGGLIGCWVEWEARHREGGHPTVDLNAVGERAIERIRSTVTENVRELLATEMPARDAAERIVRRNRERLLATSGTGRRSTARELVRSRAGRYVGSTHDGSGLHRMIFEVVDNAADQALAGYAGHISVIIHVDDSVTIEDDGRGIPVDVRGEDIRPAAEVIMTELRAGGRLDKAFGGGRRGFGVSVVTFLSEWLELEIHRDGFVWRQRYEGGIPVAPVARGEKTARHGTRVTFRPDPGIFSAVRVNFDSVLPRLRELAFLIPDLSFSILDDRTERHSEFRYFGGVISFVRELNGNETRLHAEPIFLKGERGGDDVEIAMQWKESDAANIRCFVNAIETTADDALEDGFDSALTGTFGRYLAERGVSVSLANENVRQGLTAVLSLRMRNPAVPVKEWIEQLVSDGLSMYLDGSPSDAKRITGKIARNQVEALARSELRALRYGSAVTALREAMALDPARAERLHHEFGFLLLSYPEDGNGIDALADAAARLEWSARIWRTIAAGNDLPSSDESQPAPDRTEAPEDRRPILKTQTETPERKGEALENAVARLFRTFFRIGDDNPWKIRKQKRGSQSGYDLSIEWSGKYEAVGEPKSRCHIECKNYQGEITPAKVAEKLFSELRKQPVIDHWILISPQSDASNELNQFLERQVHEETFPFEVQVWSPETGVAELFGLEPAVYDLFYEPSEGELHPRDWDETKRSEVLEKWRKRLDPPLRLPPGWPDYLRDPALLCMSQTEDPALMAQTYDTRVTMRCRNDAGALLEKPLDDYIDDWLVSDDPVCVLLGEFGDGKSFFTYSLSRRLVADWRKRRAGWIPLRFALRRLPHDPREFLRQRLNDVGASVAGWNAIGKIARRLVILDGFDEMSIQLDPETITENIRKLLACMSEFSDCKILITSRKHFFQNRRDAQRLLTRTGSARIYALAPIPRNEVLRNLSGASDDAVRRQMTERLRTMHDPIGLAGKPLFLEMLKDVLVDPGMSTGFDVVTLYDRYIGRSLQRKWEGLDDPMLETLPADTIANLRSILGEIAEVLQRSEQGYVRLSDFGSEPFARLL